MQFPKEQLRRVPFLARYNGKTLKERRTRVLLLDGNGLSTAPGRIVQLAVDRLVGTDADIILLVLGQLGQVLRSLSSVHMLSTLEVLLGAVLNLITGDGSCLLDSDLRLLALDVGSLGDLGSLDDDLSSGLVGRRDDFAAISAAEPPFLVVAATTFSFFAAAAVCLPVAGILTVATTSLSPQTLQTFTML